MYTDRHVLRDAAARGVISGEQAEALWSELDAERRRRGDVPTWRPLAAAVALAAVAGLAAAAGFHWFGFWGLASTSAALSVALLAAGRQRFARTGGARGQVLLTAGLLLPTLAALGVVRALGVGTPYQGQDGDLVDWIRGAWFPVEAVSLLACGLGLAAFRIPFLAWPLGVAGWFVAQDAAPLLFGPSPGWGQRALLSALTGLVLLAAGLTVDRRTRGDVAFWLYLPGLLALSAGLTTWREASDLAVALTALIHVGLVAAALLLERRTFAVVGALGLAAAAGRLADDLLDGQALAFALAGVAVVTLALGLGYHLHHERLARWLARAVPAPVRRLLPPGGPASRA